MTLHELYITFAEIWILITVFAGIPSLISVRYRSLAIGFIFFCLALVHLFLILSYIYRNS
jgi:hypothetical protein